ncbi:MAG: alpha/beta hydrolase [Gemmatimonadetes bacterium]|nr:alpha/beta hydrolase [Gemmatimonadota bacterium]
MIRRIGLGASALIVAGYGGAIGFLKLNETNLVFQPAAYGGRESIPLADSLGLALEEVRIPSTDGIELATWIVRVADSTAPWILSCHGNAGNITLLRRQRFYADLNRAGFNVLAFDYRGYGTSTDAQPTEPGLQADALAAYRFLRDRLAVPAERIVIYGHSLGGGVATALATEVPSAGLIVEGTFTSVPDVGKERYPWLPVRQLASVRFDNSAKIAGLQVPLMVMHARHDGTIPFRHGERLFQMARHPKRFVPLGGDHDTAWELDRDTYLPAFADFVRTVTPASARGYPAALPTSQ